MTRAVPSTVPPDNDRPGDVLPLMTYEPETNERAESLKEVVSTLLSAVAMLAMATGATWAAWEPFGPIALTVGGVLLTLLLAISDAARRPKPETIETTRASKAPVPGPTDAGRMHARGPGARS